MRDSINVSSILKCTSYFSYSIVLKNGSFCVHLKLLICICKNICIRVDKVSILETYTSLLCALIILFLLNVIKPY